MTRFDVYLDNQEALLKSQKEALRAQETQIRLNQASARENAVAHAAQIAQQQRMIGRLDSIAQEAQRQTALHEQFVAQQQQAHADQLNFQFKMWRQTDDGQRYLAWEAKARAFLEYLHRLQGEFALLCEEDTRQTKQTVDNWSQYMRSRRPTFLHRFQALIVTVIVVFPILLATFFPKINHGFGRLGGFLATVGEVISGFVFGLIISFVAYGIYYLVSKAVITGSARAVVSESLGGNEAMGQLRARYEYYFAGLDSTPKSDDEFLEKVYRNAVPEITARRSFCVPDVDTISAFYMSVIENAPQTLPVDLPELDMPQAADFATIPEESGAHAFVRAYAQALEAQ